MTNEERKVIELALEALEIVWNDDECCAMTHLFTREAITAIKEALAKPEQDIPVMRKTSYSKHHELSKAQPEQEPVAWVCYGSSDSEMHDVDFEQIDVDALPVGTMLYTTPPQRKPLTDEQIYDMYNEPRSDAEMLEFARAIEAAHGIIKE